MKYLLCFVLMVLAIFLLKNRQEGFSTAFNSCRAKGYSKEFCVQTPATHFGPAACRCPNGMLGTRLPGFGGKCVCDFF
jgi:hypothetical protein